MKNFQANQEERAPALVRSGELVYRCPIALMSLRALFVVVVWFVFSAAGVVAASFNTVVVDAGHGGSDRGGIPQNIIAEKGVALDVAKRVRTYLQDAGLRVVMTRSDDTFIPLSFRVAASNRQSNAIFVSIHFNSATRVGARGVETFYYSQSGARLASYIHRRVAATTDGDNRGIKRARYYVLRNNKKTATLVECGFLTNPQDTALARSPAYRDRLARAIAQGILDYRRQL